MWLLNLSGDRSKNYLQVKSNAVFDCTQNSKYRHKYVSLHLRNMLTHSEMMFVQMLFELK